MLQMNRTENFNGKIKQLYQEMERNEIGQLITRKTYSISAGDTKPLHNNTLPMTETFIYDENGLLIKTNWNRVTMEYTYYTE